MRDTSTGHMEVDGSMGENPTSKEETRQATQIVAFKENLGGSAQKAKRMGAVSGTFLHKAEGLEQTCLLLAS